MVEEPRIFLFEFRGEITTLEKGEVSEVVFYLNDGSNTISQEIQQEIRRALPVGVNIETQIRFYQGTIAWEGVVIVLDWMARLSGAVEFVSILSRIVKIAVERVVQKWLSRRNQLPFLLGVINPMQVEVIFQTVSGHSGQSKQPQSVSTFRNLILLTAVNTLLLITVLIVQVILR
ncbi:MAG: hypothetical protein PHD58_00590 [Anaerolineales bacterium]|jgi:hypothetical protein|nr:hypothetical protein [Anaerolineales bacterium]